MSTSQADIRDWLVRGHAQGATHVIVMCDTFDHGDYPVYVRPGENPRAVVQSKLGDMQRLMEVYALHLDWESQLREYRSYHYEMPPSSPTPKLQAPSEAVVDLVPGVPSAPSVPSVPNVPNALEEEMPVGTALERTRAMLTKIRKGDR